MKAEKAELEEDLRLEKKITLELNNRNSEVNKKLKILKDREESFNKYYDPKLKSTIEY